MEILGFLSEHWLEVITGVYLAGMVLYGHYKGFIRLVVSALALIITFTVIHFAMPHVTSYLKNETPVYGWLKNGVEKAIGLDELSESFANHENESLIIDGLELPQKIKHVLEKNNNGETYRAMGVKLFRDYVSGYLTDTILKIVVFLLLFILVFVALQVLVIWLDLIAKLPILSGTNKIAGAILGGVEALIFVWIACLAAAALSGTGIGAAVMRQIESSRWLLWLYDHNMLLYFVMGIIQGVL